MAALGTQGNRMGDWKQASALSQRQFQSGPIVPPRPRNRRVYLSSILHRSKTICCAFEPLLCPALKSDRFAASSRASVTFHRLSSPYNITKACVGVRSEVSRNVSIINGAGLGSNASPSLHRMVSSLKSSISSSSRLNCDKSQFWGEIGELEESKESYPFIHFLFACLRRNLRCCWHPGLCDGHGSLPKELLYNLIGPVPRRPLSIGSI